MANVKLSQIASGGAFVAGTDTIVTVRNGTTDVLTTLVNPSANVSSVSNSDSTLTISPTTGDVVASLNVSHANTWGALQTFGNNISFGGAALNVTSLISTNLLQYNG